MGNWSSSQRSATLLDMDDHLLCEIFKSVSTYDKLQHVQRACMRFRNVLQRPSIPETWGCVAVKVQQDTDTSPESLRRLVTWLLDRKSGADEQCSVVHRDSLISVAHLRRMTDHLVPQQAFRW